MKYVKRGIIVLLFMACIMALHGCGGDISGDGMDTGSFLTAFVTVPLDVDACDLDNNVYADVTFDNQDLPVPGATDGETDESGIIHTSRHITIDRYTIEYIPIDPIASLSVKEYFKTLQLPPNSSTEFTDIHFLDVTTKQEFLSFTSSNPGITNGAYSVVYRFYGHNDLGADVSVVATESFHISGNCP